MGQISSGIGLISGINTADLIDQLLALEARPKTLIQQRNIILTTQQTAFQGLEAKLLASKLSASTFPGSNIFDSTTAASSDESVLTVSSSTSATPGTFDLTVDRLVSSQQTITNGFADGDSTIIGPSGATFMFELADSHLTSTTDLERLNGASGVQRGKISITDGDGDNAIIDLSKARTVNDVLEAINSAITIDISASVSGDRFIITDTNGDNTPSVLEVNNGTTAADLGLNVVASMGVITGSVVNNIGNNTPLSTLNDGNGVHILDVQDDIRITRRDGTMFNVDFANATTIQDIVNAINTASGGDVTASVSANGTDLTLVNTTPSGGDTFAVTALNGSNAATDLGIDLRDDDADGTIDGNRVVATFNSRLIKNLKGGSGVNLGTVDITNRSGNTDTVDFSTVQSVEDIVRLLNDNVTDVIASVNNAGNGIILNDTTGSTVSNLIVTDVSSTTAADLNITGSFAANSVDSGNLQFRFISKATLLSSLNGGQGIARASFNIRDSNGKQATVDLSQGNEKTIGDVVDEINTRGLALTATVNANGDGIIVQDTGGGSQAIMVTENGSSTAKDLGLLGQADNPGDDFIGSFEKNVTVLATDTLDDVAQKINTADVGVRAIIINDGSGINPFRLNLRSEASGRAGRFLFDDGGTNLGASLLSRADDAVVFFGNTDPANAVAITSSSNTLNTVIPGVTINLAGTSTSPVQIVISRDDKAVEDAIRNIVDDVNEVLETIDELDSFNTETEERGLLLGDPTLARVSSALFNLFNSSSPDVTGQFKFVTQIGIRIGTGAKLQFDSDRFRTALETDRASVEQLLTLETRGTNAAGEQVVTAAGFGSRLEQLLDRFTDSFDGTISTRVDTIENQIELNNDRIEQMDELLEAKRARLAVEFAGMERALAQLQAQNSALVGLQPLISSAATRR